MSTNEKSLELSVGYDEFIDLQDNVLNNITELCFDDCDLDIDDKYIYSSTFLNTLKQCTSLESLSLDGYYIKTINSTFFNCIPNIKSLSLINNQIDKIEGMENLKELSHLYLSQNNISEFNYNSENSKLKYLLIHDNPIEKFNVNENIIENLDQFTCESIRNKKNIYLCGNLRSGKDTIQDLIISKAPNKYNKYSFATLLKQLAVLYLGRSINKNTDRELLQDIGANFRAYENSEDAKKFVHNLFKQININYENINNVISFIDYINNVIYKDSYCWVSALFSKLDYIYDGINNNVILNDMRYKNESCVIMNHNPNNIILKIVASLDLQEHYDIIKHRVIRTDKVFDESMLKHESEIEINDIKSHYTLINKDLDYLSKIGESIKTILFIIYNDLPVPKNLQNILIKNTI